MKPNPSQSPKFHPTFPSFVVTTQWSWHLGTNVAVWWVCNNEIFNLHLGLGASPSVSNPCLLQGTSHIDWLYLPKQSTNKKQKILQAQQTPNKYHGIALTYMPWQNLGLGEVDVEQIPQGGSAKINRLRPRRKSTTENELYHTAWTHK